MMGELISGYTEKQVVGGKLGEKQQFPPREEKNFNLP